MWAYAAAYLGIVWALMWLAGNPTGFLLFPPGMLLNAVFIEADLLMSDLLYCVLGYVAFPLWANALYYIHVRRRAAKLEEAACRPVGAPGGKPAHAYAIPLRNGVGRGIICGRPCDQPDLGILRLSDGEAHGTGERSADCRARAVPHGARRASRRSSRNWCPEYIGLLPACSAGGKRPIGYFRWQGWGVLSSRAIPTLFPSTATARRKRSGMSGTRTSPERYPLTRNCSGSATSGRGLPSGTAVRATFMTIASIA